MNITTICRDCIFSEYRDGIQSGCSYNNRLEIFRSQKRAIMTNEGYYVINGMCNACRNLEWAAKTDNIEKNIEEEIQLKVDYLLLGVNTLLSLQKVLSKVKQILSDKILPNRFIFVFYNQSFSYKELIDNLDCLNINYKIVQILEENSSEYRMLDLAFKNVVAQYYSVFYIEEEVPKDHITFLNDLINKKMLQISMIKPQKNINGLTVQTLLHKNLNGSIPQLASLEMGHEIFLSTVVDKIEWLAKTQNKKEMVLDYESYHTGRKL